MNKIKDFVEDTLLPQLNEDWLKGSGVTAKQYNSFEIGEPSLLVLELTGEKLEKIIEAYGNYRDGKLLLNWLLPNDNFCDLYNNEKSYSSPYLFNRPEFQVKDEKKISLCPDLDFKDSFIIPSWFYYARQLWRSFAKNINEGKADIAELVRLESGLNALFISSSARNAARIDDAPALKNLENLENPLAVIESSRGVKINAAWNRGGLGRLRIPHASNKYKLCPFETPESSRIGLNLNLAADAEVTSDGKIKAGNCLLSVAVGMVPYPTHTDGPRLMMGGKNMKQAEPGIDGAEPPIVPGYYEGNNALKIKALQEHLDDDNRLTPYIGLNALTLIMPFKGYTYEDGLAVSKSLAERFNINEGSYSFAKKFNCMMTNEDVKKAGIERRDIKNLIKLFKQDQEKAIGTRFVYGDLLPDFNLPLYYDEENYGEQQERKANLILKPYVFRDIYAHHAPGVLKEVNIEINLTQVTSESDKNHNHVPAHHMTVSLIWKFEVKRPLALGDKLTGRNGNKGVVTKILPDNKMPKIEINGKKLRAELIISPSSIMGRKNLGQIWEMTHSLLIKELKEDIEDYELPGGEKYAENISPLFRRLKEIGADDRGTFKITGDGVPEGTRAFAGWQYFCRLHHYSWKKLQARGRYAPFEPATGQPMRCGARTGQRLGEMENWSLLSHGAGKVLDSMRAEQTGNFVNTQELLISCLKSLGINFVKNNLNSGLEFIKGHDNLKFEDNEETLQNALICEEHKSFHVTYLLSESKNKKTGELKDRQTLRERFEDALSRLEDGKLKDAADKILKLKFFDEVGGMHIETALLKYYKKLSEPLWKFFRGGTDYERVEGILEYRQGLLKILSGKEGIPRRYLLGRRYNHSGRAVIVPEPSLVPHELYLPSAMLIEMLDGYDSKYLYNLYKLKDFNFNKLRAIVNDCPERLKEAEDIADKLDNFLLENNLWCFAVRQPSLHRHSVQAFKIRCWAEPVIGLPPFVTPGFNADFDGDTMAVFLPPYKHAKDLSSYSVENNPGLVGTGKHAFADGLDLALGFWNLEGKKLADYLPEFLKNINNKSFEERGRAIQELQIKICESSTGAATLTPFEFDEICADIRGIAKEEANYKEAEAKLKEILNNNKNFGLAVMLDSGAKGKLKDVLQMTWALGEIHKMKDEDGETEESEKDFIAGCFWEGLTEDELFRYSYPSRYSMAQKKLSVAEAGYLTRQLAEGLYELVIEDGDCGTQEGLKVEYFEDIDGKACVKLEDIIVPTLGNLKKDLTRILWGRVELGKAEPLNMQDIENIAAQWEEEKRGELIIRSPLKCSKREAGHVCSVCYGADLAMKPFDKPATVRGGFAAGMTAAQAIGERGTQLAMKRFHDVAGGNKDQEQEAPNAEKRNAIKELRSLFIFNNRTGNLLDNLFNRVLIKEFKKDDKDKNDKLYDADGELPQALIHFETALVPVAAKGEGLDKLAKKSEGRFLSALANERIDELLSGEGPFNDDLESIKSRLIWGDDK